MLIFEKLIYKILLEKFLILIDNKSMIHLKYYDFSVFCVIERKILKNLLKGNVNKIYFFK